MNALISSNIESLPLVARGKVRDLYALGNDYLLMIATDRLSAYDVVMHEAVPNKGEILTRISNFWFSQLGEIIPNHLKGIDPRSVVKPLEMIQVDKRAVVVKKLKPILIEAVVRGYLAGSAWKEYQTQGTLSGHWLYTNLQIGDKFAEPLFTPASKEAGGAHDENITYAEVENRLGQKLASQIKDSSIELYLAAAKISLEKGMILADIKFEFGLDGNDQLVLMDEVLTPDSSRYWPAETYQPGSPPPSLDKQFLRDWLESTLFVGKKWNKVTPPPSIPDDILAQVSSRYKEVSLRLGIYEN